MPDKHEVGGSTPLEPTSRQSRQPRIGGSRKGFEIHHTMGSKAERESLKQGERGKEEDSERLIQRISSFRERDSDPIEPTSRENRQVRMIIEN